ncbi:MAG: transposase [Candidatus Marinimicrobia bacterium]|nr:transposase [Candidatus Neomarinimicrobiota bacterium]
MRTQRRNYPKEFKTEAVELMLNSERPAKEIAEGLGIEAHMLHRWKREYLATKDHAFPGKGKIGDSEEVKFRELQKQMRDVEEERDILKKALAIFSKQTR